MTSCRTITGLILSFIGVVASFSSFVFLFFGNYHAAAWAFFSGVLAAIDFHLLVLHYRRTLMNWHSASTVGDFKILAFSFFLIGLGATFWYIFMFVYYNLPILPIPDSYQIAAVWSFMTAKWGLGLWFTAQYLAHQLDEFYPQLLVTVPYNPSRYSHYY